MKLDKAKEILSDMLTYQYSASTSDQHDTLKLFIELGNRFLLARREHILVNTTLLPGETTD